MRKWWHRVLCRVFGHKWSRELEPVWPLGGGPPDPGVRWYCERCNKDGGLEV